MKIAPPPPKLRYGATRRAGLGISTAIGDFDFETYSPAGFIKHPELNKFIPPHGADKKGLFTVGAAAYSEHPDAEVLSLAYDLKDGKGIRHWTPDLALNYYAPNKTIAFWPQDLFDHLNNGGLLEAWNVSFEYWIWTNVCVPKYGFPPLPVGQLRCAMAKSRASAYPGSLADAGEVLNIKNKKLKEGDQLIKLFCYPRDPTKNNTNTRIIVTDDPEAAQRLYAYNIRDIEAESELSQLIPDLPPQELEFWQCDQAINRRGIQIDIESINSCIVIIEQAHAKYNAELCELTGGEVKSASEIAKLLKWVHKQFDADQIDYVIKKSEDYEDNDFYKLGFGKELVGPEERSTLFTNQASYHRHSILVSLNEESINTVLKIPNLLPQVKRALEIRQLLSSAAVKKLYSMLNRANKNSRLNDLFIYHAARTGRTAGTGPQPQNLPKSGPQVWQCDKCQKHNGNDIIFCAWCAEGQYSALCKWNPESVNDALEIINTKSLECVEYYFSNAIDTVSGCLRSLFIPAPGHDFICSDFHSIEAVVLAGLSGEEWRLEVFRTHGMLYEMSASLITGIPFEEFELHKATTGQHHPMRNQLGKFAELGSGFGGWTGAWLKFGAGEFLTEDQIKKSILAWRAASPAIVEMWGGQERNWQPEYFGLEGMAIMAILSPGQEYEYRGMIFLVQDDILYAWHENFPGSNLTYHKPRLEMAKHPRRGYQITFEGWNTNPMKGGVGWMRMNIYGGLIAENFTQKIARFIMMYALCNLEKAGYPIVLHVHDEALAEVKKGFGSIMAFERIMSIMPAGAKDWPIKASGGWRGERYGKRD